LLEDASGRLLLQAGPCCNPRTVFLRSGVLTPCMMLGQEEGSPVPQGMLVSGGPSPGRLCSISLCHCATVPLHHCVTVSLCHCVVLPGVVLPCGCSQEARMREEVISPFRTVRMFLYIGFIGSAGVGALVAGVRLLGVLAGGAGDGLNKGLEGVPHRLRD